MHVRRLNLVDFRNYESADLEFADGINVLVGSNGQGKTNLVEALGYLSTLGSHRVSGDLALVRHGSTSAVVRALLGHADREFLVELQINAGAANKAQVSRSPAKVRDLPRYFSSVLFAPEDLALVRGDPSGRRRFLDELLVLRTPRLAGVVADYERSLRQRNTLLKSARGLGSRAAGALSTLEVWDERLIDFGSQIVAARMALVDDLRPRLEESYRAIVDADHRPGITSQLSILSTRPDADEAGTERADSALPEELIRDRFTSALAAVRSRELERGLTLVGPHRDDAVFELNGLPARGYASHGESWSFALSLKLSSAALLRAEASSGDPVLILDDVFAELDAPRRRALALAIRDYEQVLITAAVAEDVPEGLEGRMIRIKAGRIVDAGVAADATGAEATGDEVAV
jgi:DNA replication and repair protein RecF